ncbi:MAG: hypothetical protein HY608_05420 [Planctomycetes bacterium]|nr:hypothetical protein [Planctomycetota bacterium]
MTKKKHPGQAVHGKGSMDKESSSLQVPRVVALLEGEDQELACAAARILGYLLPEDPAVRSMLRKAAGSANGVLSGYAMDALGRSPGPDMVPVLAAAMGRDGAVRAKAIDTYKRLATPPIEPLARMIRTGPTSARLAASDILSTLGTREALEALLEIFRGTDAQAIEAAAGHLLSALPRADDATRKALRDEAARIVGSLSPDKAPRAIAHLIPLAKEAQDAPGRWAARYLKARTAPEIACAALRSLVPGEVDATLTAPLLDLARQGTAQVVEATLPLLANLPVRESHLGALLELVRAGASARTFALKRIETLDTSRTVSALLKALEGADEGGRNDLADTLGRMRCAPPLLLRRLQPGAPSPLARALGRALRLQGERLSGAFVRQARTRFLELVRKEDPVSDILLDVLQVADRAGITKTLLEEALRSRKSKRFRESARLVHLASKLSPDDFETRYAEAILSLQQSSLALTPRARQTDTALARFSSLGRSHHAKLLTRLGGDREVPPQALYFLGFHLSDGAPPMDALGCDLLGLFLRRAPKHPSAEAAKNILKRVRRPGRGRAG